MGKVAICQIAQWATKEWEVEKNKERKYNLLKIIIECYRDIKSNHIE